MLKNPIEMAQLWVGALRSGEYTQTKDQLRKSDEEGQFSYCCLGVLCDLVAKNGGEPWFDDEKYGRNEATHFLPTEIERWIGLSGQFSTKLITLNDNDTPFVEIADRIENELLSEIELLKG